MTDFIAPAERETGDLVTAAIWNQDVVANTQALFDEKFGHVPDYDSGWFAVVYNTTYTKAHGFAIAPVEIILWHATPATPGAAHELVRVTDVKDGDGEGSDWALGPGETIERLAGSAADYAGRFALSADKARILADGADEARVTLTTTLSLLAVIAETPGPITIEPADRVAFAAAGMGTLSIEAVEAD